MHLQSKINFESIKTPENGPITDAKCVLCAEWCTSKSSCSDRFFGLQGYFEGTDDVLVIYSCDECFTLDDPFAEIEQIHFKDKGDFIVDCSFRMND